MANIAESLASTPDASSVVQVTPVPDDTVATLQVVPTTALATPAPTPAPMLTPPAAAVPEHFVTAAGQVVQLQSLALGTPESTEETKPKPHKRSRSKHQSYTAKTAKTAVPAVNRAEVVPLDVVLSKVTLPSEQAAEGAALPSASSSSGLTVATAAALCAQQLLSSLRSGLMSEPVSTADLASSVVTVAAQEPTAIESEPVQAMPASVGATDAVAGVVSAANAASAAGAAGAEEAAGTGAIKEATVAAELTAEEQARYSSMELKEGDPCPHCGQGTLVVRHTEHVDFLGCTCFPSCKLKVFLHRLNQVTTMQVLKSTCPQCSKPLAVKKGRYGLFIGCSNYPECTYVFKEQNEDLPKIVCPQCHKGQLEARRARSGSIFFGCNAYPKCAFILPGRPVLSPCPECGFSLRFQKKVKAGIAIVCGNPLCDSRRRRKHEMLPRS